MPQKLQKKMAKKGQLIRDTSSKKLLKIVKSNHFLQVYLYEILFETILNQIALQFTSYVNVPYINVEMSSLSFEL